MIRNGIDVSEWQGAINWERVKTDFAILRAGYGRLASQTDRRFEANYRGCSEADIPVGAYWYSYAMSVEEAVQEANAFLEVVKGKRFEYPMYYDVEEAGILSLGRTRISAIIRSFIDTLENAGYFAGLYMSADNLTAYTEEYIRERYAIWVAEYGVSNPDYSGTYGMWQKSSTGSVGGINGNVDLDEAYEDYPSIIRAAGLNGLKSDAEAPHRLTVIIDGKTIIRNQEFLL